LLLKNEENGFEVFGIILLIYLSKYLMRNLGLLGEINLESIIKHHDADRYYKSFKSKTHLITMLFGIISRCDSMGEICEGMRAMSGKLNHLGLKSSPAKSTACDGLRN
ncbi:MAG TPA: DUF4372 domain-containing protein, partial [Dysgonamonadaceae bacterium]|nr:DUF4372 domain-containing protein [Dysgonamonadaceae bacterium]